MSLSVTILEEKQKKSFTKSSITYYNSEQQNYQN